MDVDRLLYKPDPDVVRGTRLAAFLRQHQLLDLPDLLRRAEVEPDWYWRAVLEFFDIRFVRPYDKVLDLSAGIESPRWCVGGTTNVVLNCLDRHRGTSTWSKTAIIWDGDDGSKRTWTYAELDAEVGRLAAVLRSRQIGVGDVVAIYMPMIPEAAAAFFAIAKIGAIAMPLFSGFGSRPISERLVDAEARAVISADIAWRRGKVIRMKETLDQALATVDTVHTVVLLARADPHTPGSPTRDVSWPTEQAGDTESATTIVDAEAPVMLMYTSGTTGKPKGTIHTHCGILAKNALDLGLCIDMKASDRLLWMSDMGWIVGPKIIISSTLLGSTLILAEGTPDWPDKARMWRNAADHGATIVGIVPTTVRQMMRRGPDCLDGHDLSALRATISIGEPWTPEAWAWFFEHVCKFKIPILNYAGGTECGGAILISSFLGPLRPCSFGHAVPGCGADIVDASGKPVPPGEIGELVMRHPSIGLTRGLWRAPERYLEGYWRVIPGLWVQGDLASRDADGLWYLHGRSDDVIKIAGKRTGPAEIEAVLLETGLVTDVAVVGVPDAITGSALACACVSDGLIGDQADLAKSLANVIAKQFGTPYRPSHFVFVSELPRTRNQKMMRRVIRAILTGMPLGDLSSLANPESIDALRSASPTIFAKYDAGGSVEH